MSGNVIKLSDIENLAVVSSVGFLPNRELSYEEWERCGAALQRMSGAIQWWLGDWHNYGESRYGEKYAQAIEETGYKVQTLMNAASVARSIETSRRREVLSWSHHDAVASLDPEEQDMFLDAAEENGWTRKELRKAVRDYKKRLNAPKPIDGKFRVIYADPPWQYSDELIDGYGAAEHHYPTMTLDELKAEPVTEKCYDDAVLFLWVTSPMLPDGLELMEAWGFVYKASFVWDKLKHNYGHYNSVRHELLLLGTRGSCTPDDTTLYDSVVSEERGPHSAKPSSFRKMIDALYEVPTDRKDRIEMYARRDPERPDHWETHGNE